ncbi:MAG: site-specific integrase [Chloroflexi bacterium]|nr:MAG: site-specific integrase [Chloroflexota bacterium]
MQVTSFQDVPDIRPALPQYLLTARKDDSGQELSLAYMQKIIRSARRFFDWLSKHEKGYRSITVTWLDTLRPPRVDRQSQKYVAVTLEEVLEIAKAPANNIEERRIRAAACFWFLSGIRIGAFVTLPIEAIDLHELSVKQWPSLGVKTKFKKHATTYLLDVPELLQVVRDWDMEIRKTLGDSGLWFAPFSVETGEIEKDNKAVGNHRQSRARKSLKAWLRRVGLSYHKPHSFRHGHAVYSIQLAGDVSDLKAISMNLMHDSLTITEKVYGIFSSLDVKQKITSLTWNRAGKEQDSTELIDVLEKTLEALKSQS